jgi:hypothetical protein
MSAVVSRSRHIPHASLRKVMATNARTCGALGRIKEKKRSKEKIDNRDRSSGGCFE